MAPLWFQYRENMGDAIEIAHIILPDFEGNAAFIGDNLEYFPLGQGIHFHRYDIAGQIVIRREILAIDEGRHLDNRNTSRAESSE